ncbi:MAG: 4Fe-4S dicluster domain-containing protein [Bacillota bacterium]
MKFLAIDSDKCNGCRLCELACSLRAAGTMQPARSRISVLKWEERLLNLPFTCFQCERALCAEVCPVNAIARDGATGALVVSKERCLGCGMCTQACPFGTIALDRPLGQASKCDLCGGEPRCVTICPTGAITYAPGGRTGLDRRRAGAGKLASLLQLVEGGGPQ